MSTAEKICPTCGTEYPANERFCPRDGSALRSQGGGNDLVGSIIAERYHVMKKLGEGGMGQVYLAEHVKMGRKSAVKVMNPGMVQDADAISRFNREAANASRINHPNVAGIYDFGETPDGLIYLAMEFIEGQSLTALVESQGALQPMRAADITKQTADGLQVAHDMGIVHRDLKPDNIMITKNRDGSDCVKVVDFGIAKAAGAENQKVTKTGLVVGTPEYMSPEQLAGDKLDGRSDCYSLALVAFNMLTGKLPFPSESQQESMIMRLTDEPKSLIEMKPDTSWSPRVQQVMQKALARKKEDRYQSVAEFGRDLYLAVEQMPKGAPAATQMIGAMDGATAVMSAPPPTRVDAAARSTPAAPPAPAPVATSMPGAPAKSKAPMMAGIAAAVVILGGGAFFMMNKGASPAPAATADTTKSVAGVTAPNPGAGQVAQAPTGQPSSVPSNSQTKSATPPKSTPGAPTIADRLPKLLEESTDDAKADAARREAVSLLPKATTDDERVGLILVQAQAFGIKNDTARGCPLLRDIAEKAKLTSHASQVSSVLKASC